MHNEHTTEKGSGLGGASWLTIGLAVLTVVTFLAVAGHRGQYGYPVMMSGGWAEDAGGGTKAVPPMMQGSAGNVSAPSAGMMRPDYYPPPGDGEVPVTDTREFLKTYYSAQLKTRDVPGLTRRVETTVRGYGGRIDSQSSSEKYGFVSFALPEGKYEAFRTELEGMVGSRFIKVDISSQNLLSQKVSIEEQQEQADKNLADYKTARATLTSSHTSAVKALQAKIDATTDSAVKAELTKQLAYENSRYTSQLQSIDANIKYATEWQKAVQTQDKKLLESVATVTGTVSLQWISLWDMLQLYLPGYWVPTIFALLTLASLYYDRRRARAANA